MRTATLHAGMLEGQKPAAPSPKLVRAAHEFEGQMIEQLLKPFSESGGLGGDEDESGAGSTLGDFATQALGEALSQQGGFGIANKIVKELSHSGTSNGSISDPGKVTGNMHRNTVMRGS